MNIQSCVKHAKWQIQRVCIIVSLSYWPGEAAKQAASWFLPPSVCLGLKYTLREIHFVIVHTYCFEWRKIKNQRLFMVWFPQVQKASHGSHKLIINWARWHMKLYFELSWSPFKCEFCNTNFVEYENLKRPIESVHERKKPSNFKCDSSLMSS